MDIQVTTSGTSFGKMSYPCHIRVHVISVTSFSPCHIHVIYFFKKDLVLYPKLKKLHLVDTTAISSHVICRRAIPIHALSMSYVCQCVRLSGSGPQMKFSRKLHCGSSSAYHGTAFIKHNKIYLPKPRARNPPLPPALGGDPAGAGSCAPAGTCLSVGSAGEGSAGVWGFLGVLDSARALCAVTPLAPAMPSTP